MVERRAKKTSFKSEKRPATPRDSAREAHAYQHGREELKHHKGPASRVAVLGGMAVPPQPVEHSHPVPIGTAVPLPYRHDLNAF